MAKYKSLKCFRCGSSNIIKFGFVRNEQRYFCKDCQRSFQQSSKRYPREIYRMVIHLYLENYSLRNIADMMDLTLDKVHYWINTYAPELKSIRKNDVRSKKIEVRDAIGYINKSQQIEHKKWFVFGVGNKPEIIEIKPSDTQPKKN